MRKLLCSGLIAVLPFFAQAQISLSFSVAPNAGDTVVTNNFAAATPGALPVAAPGAAQTYNYSQKLHIDNRDTTFYVAPSATPFGAQIGSRSNVASYQGRNTTQYEYFSRKQTTPQSFGLAALIVDGSSFGVGPIPFLLSQDLKIMQYPANYLSTYTTTATGSFTLPYDTVITLPGVGSVPVDSVRIRLNLSGTSNINGYGTLVLPRDSSYQVLLQNFQQNVSIAVDIHYIITIGPIHLPNWQNNAFSFPAQKSYSQNFYANGKKGPVLTLNQDSNGVVTSAAWQGDTAAPLAVAPLHAGQNLKVYPNPSSGSVSVNLPDAASSTTDVAYINLTDAAGREVALNETALGHNLNISLEKQPAGTYQVQVRSKNGTLLASSSVVFK